MEKSEQGAVGSDGTCIGCVLHHVWWKKQENVVRFKLMREEWVSFTKRICVCMNVFINILALGFFPTLSITYIKPTKTAHM